VSTGGYRAIFIDPSEFNDTELGSEVRAAWADGARVIELIEPRVNPHSEKARMPEEPAAAGPLSDEALERAYSAFRNEYLRIFPSGGDEQSHDEATESAIVAAIRAALREDSDAE